MALNGLLCADVPLRDYSLAHSVSDSTVSLHFERSKTPDEDDRSHWTYPDVERTLLFSAVEDSVAVDDVAVLTGNIENQNDAARRPRALRHVDTRRVRHCVYLLSTDYQQVNVNLNTATELKITSNELSTKHYS